MERKRYNKEFKMQIVKMYESGKKAREIEKEYGIAQSLIYRWVRQYIKTESFKTSDNLTEAEKTIKILEKENQRLKMEVDILKQAALIMSQR